MDEWIPVEERLPENGQRVLTYWPEGYYTLDIQQFYRAGSYHLDAWWLGGSQNHLVENGDITHWMPPPEGPQGE